MLVCVCDASAPVGVSWLLDMFMLVYVGYLCGCRCVVVGQHRATVLLQVSAHCCLHRVLQSGQVRPQVLCKGMRVIDPLKTTRVWRTQLESHASFLNCEHGSVPYLASPLTCKFILCDGRRYRQFYMRPNLSYWGISKTMEFLDRGTVFFFFSLF